MKSLRLVLYASFSTLRVVGVMLAATYFLDPDLRSIFQEYPGMQVVVVILLVFDGFFLIREFISSGWEDKPVPSEIHSSGGGGEGNQTP